MAFAMPRPVSRPNSTFQQFRKRVPAGIQRLARGKHAVFKQSSACSGNPELFVPAKSGSEITFSPLEPEIQPW
jgi:hypothetical protein